MEYYFFRFIILLSLLLVVLFNPSPVFGLTFNAIYIYIYIYESKYGSKSDSMKKAEKQNNPKRCIYCDVKSTLNVSVSIAFIRTLILEEFFTQRWTLVEKMEAKRMYATEKIQNVHITFLI